MDGIITENVFELLAAVVLDALVLARVLFYVIAKKRREFPGRIVLLSGITLLQAIILVRLRCISWLNLQLILWSRQCRA